MYELQGVAVCIISVGFLYFFYQIGRYYKTLTDLEERYSLFEIALINKKANGKGINLDKEKSRLRTYNMIQGKRTIKDELKKEIISEMFDNKPIEKQKMYKEK